MMTNIPTAEQDGHMSHRLFEWTAMGLFVWLAMTGLGLWRPGYHAWSLMAGGAGLLWTLLMFDDIARGVNHVRGNPIYWPIFGCAVILAGHLLVDQYLPQIETSRLVGSVNVSMFFHLELIAMAILLAQRLAETPRCEKIFRDALGLVMMLGGSITVALTPPGPGVATIWLIGASGVCIWIFPLTRAVVRDSVKFHFSDLSPIAKLKLLLRLVVGVGAFSLLVIISDALCLKILLGCVGITALLYISARLDSKLARAGVVAVIFVSIVGLSISPKLLVSAGPVGLGEKGFSLVSASDGGLSVLAATTGPVGVSLVLLGALSIAAVGLRRVRQASPEKLKSAALWVLATCLASAGLASPGGLFSPAEVVALAVVWGFWPIILGRNVHKPRSAWFLLASVLALGGLVAVVRSPGLLGAMGRASGLGDKGQHFLAGFLVSTVVVWIMGRRWWWLGVAGLVLAACAGGVAELMQKEFSTTRGVELADWEAHAIGSATAGLIFVVAIAYRGALNLSAKRDRRRRRSGFYLSNILRPAVLLGVLAFAGWWSWSVCKAIDHRWKNANPTITVSDALVTSQGKRSILLPGRTNDKTAVIARSILTAVPGRGNPELGWQSDKRGLWRVMPRLSGISPGVIKPTFKGMPYGPLAYQQRQGLVVCISPGQAVLAIDARDARRWLDNSFGLFNRMMDTLSPGRTVVFVHPGPMSLFVQDRAVIRQEYPEIPCVFSMAKKPSYKRTARTLRGFLVQGKSQPRRITVVTTSIDCARAFRKYFGRRCRAYLVGKKPPSNKKRRTWRRLYTNLKTLAEDSQ